MLIDTHAHLCDVAFDGDRTEVLERARRAGIGTVVAVAETLAEAERNLELAALYPGMVQPAAGLFPTILDLEQAEKIAAWIHRHQGQLAAIGEVGLDFWKVQEDADREVQKQIFGLFIDLAQEVDLPLNIHSRAAGRQTIEMLLERGASRVQLHAFDGRAAKALPAVEAGYFFSVPPSVVRSAQKQKLIRQLPLTSLLVETDSPVLGPDAAARNEPANAKFSVQAIAEIKSLPLPEVAATVTDNTIRLYGQRLIGGTVAG
jgi:TatD DNase family protein